LEQGGRQRWALWLQVVICRNDPDLFEQVYEQTQTEALLPAAELEPFHRQYEALSTLHEAADALGLGQHEQARLLTRRAESLYPATARIEVWQHYVSQVIEAADRLVKLLNHLRASLARLSHQADFDQELLALIAAAQQAIEDELGHYPQ